MPGGEVIDLNQIEGFEQLDLDQKHFLVKYMELFPRRLAAAQALGVPVGKVKRWFDDPEFALIADTVREYYAESLASVHYEDAIDNSKIRAQVLRSLGAPGYEAKPSKVNTQNNVVVTNGLHNLIEAFSKPKPTEGSYELTD